MPFRKQERQDTQIGLLLRLPRFVVRLEHDIRVEGAACPPVKWPC